MFQGRLKGVFREFSGCKDELRKYYSCLDEVSMAFQECFKGVVRKCSVCFKEY